MRVETPLTQNDIDTLLESYRNRTRQNVLCSTYSIGHPRLKRILIENGFTGGWRDAYPLNEHAFSDPTSPEMAYWTGFLMADGNVTNKGRISVKLAAKDAVHLEDFRSFIGSGHAIHRRSDYTLLPQGNRGTYESVSLGFHSKQMASDLADAGVTPNKTHTAKFGESMRMNRYAWLGLIDGDGSIRIHGNSPRLFLCGSIPMLQQFNSFISSMLSLTEEKIHNNNGRVPQFHVTGIRAQKVVNALWGGHTLGLARKRSIAEKVMSMTIRKPGRPFRKDIEARLEASRAETEREIRRGL